MLAHPFRGFRGLGLLAGLFTVFSLNARGQNSVNLAWNQETGASIAGYRLYSGTASQTYTNLFDVGNRSTATVSNLVSGRTYYFAVTAYDLTGIESVYSSEVSFLVPSNSPAPVNLSLSFTPARNATLSGRAAPGSAYDVLVSSNLTTWVSIAHLVTGTNGLLQFAEPIARAVGARYYRLQQTSP